MALGAFSSGIGAPEGAFERLDEKTRDNTLDPSSDLAQALVNGGNLRRLRKITRLNYNSAAWVSSGGSNYYVPTPQDDLILVDMTSATTNHVVALPDARAYPGREITVKRIDFNAATTYYLYLEPFNTSGGDPVNQPIDNGNAAINGYFLQNGYIIEPPNNAASTGETVYDTFQNSYTVVSDGTQWYLVTKDMPTLGANSLLGRTRAGRGQAHQVKILANTGIVFANNASAGGELSLDRTSQSDMEAGGNTTKVVMSGYMIYFPGVAKAHVRFNPAGTIQGTAFNVSSITDNAVGDWTVNTSGITISSAHPQVTVEHTAPLIAVVDSRPSGSTFRIKCYDLTGTLTDPTFINFVLFGDLT